MASVDVLAAATAVVAVSVASVKVDPFWSVTATFVAAPAAASVAEVSEVIWAVACSSVVVVLCCSVETALVAVDVGAWSVLPMGKNMVEPCWSAIALCSGTTDVEVEVATDSEAAALCSTATDEDVKVDTKSEVTDWEVASVVP